MIYRPMQQDYNPNAALVVRTKGDPAPRVAAVRDAIQTLDKNMPLRNTETVQEQIVQGLWASRMGAGLLSIFGGLALVLAVIGIYGVMSYVVTLRTQEMGVRLALGAQPADIARLVLGQAARLVVTGLVLGLIGAALLTRLLSTMLFEITPTDPVTYAMVAGVLALTAVAACQIPAWRATRVDPLTALRSE